MRWRDAMQDAGRAAWPLPASVRQRRSAPVSAARMFKLFILIYSIYQTDSGWKVGRADQGNGLGAVHPGGTRLPRTVFRHLRLTARPTLEDLFSIAFVNGAGLRRA